MRARRMFSKIGYINDYEDKEDIEYHKKAQDITLQ